MEVNTTQRALGAVGILVGLSFVFAPRLVFRLFGMNPGELTNGAKFGWRLFAARNLVIGTAVASGSRGGQQLVVPIQAVDQAVFWVSWKRGEIPLRTALMSAATSGLVIALASRS
jgi:hypothetical protein